MPRLSFLHSDPIYQFSQDKTLCLLYLLSVGLSRLDVWFRFRVSSMCWFGSSFRVSRGQFVLLRGKLCSSSHVGFHALLCDVTALAWSWTSPDGWLRGERPADRRALEGAVAKAGSVASRSSREFRDSRESRERARTRARRF